VTLVPFRRKRSLGQHFLIDENIVAVAGRLAELGPEDIVLEIGPGLGVLTHHLADRVALVHAIEVDWSLEPHLRGRFGVRENVNLLFDDALAYPLGDLAPPPSKLVSNLPYNVATPLVAESLDGLPTVGLWCVMVQREVADRFFAEPGTKSYGAVSVLVQLTAKRTGRRQVARTCFRPPPSVDSTLVAFRRKRTWDGEFEPLRRLVQAAFAHRRKTLANTLELAGLAERERVAAALAQLGHAAGARAESLAPEEYPRLAELIS
jgi:16S rRNA (adenine1518-N6/adenine1519-N6)-dimethyltransferase